MRKGADLEAPMRGFAAKGTSRSGKRCAYRIRVSSPLLGICSMPAEGAP